MRSTFTLALLATLLFAACGQPIQQTNDSGMEIAFFYQNVAQMVDGVGLNSVRVGSCTDGLTVSGSGEDVLDWEVAMDRTQIASYGDPVYSRLSNGSWAITSWSGQSDPRGAGYLLYQESACPLVDDDTVIAIGPSSAQGCSQVDKLTMAKSSQVFAAENGNYVFHMIGGEIYLAQLSDADDSAMDLESMCVLETPVDALSDLSYGESTRILSSEDVDGLSLSDTAIAQRSDGTWVLFVKGIKLSGDCKGGNLCELCGRSVYRSTSTDLIHWSALEKVVGEASIPEAVTTVDGTVWLYWQDFSNACEAQDLKVAALAPISGAYELPNTYELSAPQHVSFPDEEFETNSKMHYATNGNPVALPDEEAVAAFEACME